jgi:hypothetical protein
VRRRTHFDQFHQRSCAAFDAGLAAIAGALSLSQQMLITSFPSECPCAFPRVFIFADNLSWYAPNRAPWRCASMANIVELAVDQSPPKGIHWAMVVINEADATVGEPTIRHTMGATFYTKPADAAVDRAIARAVAWADARGIEFVYVRRLGLGAHVRIP